MYNFQVKGWHSYFAAPNEGATLGEFAWVHNANYGTRRAAFAKAKESVGIPRSQQPTRSWTIHDPQKVKGPGIRDSNVRNQGRVYEFEKASPYGGKPKKVYIAEHPKDKTHKGQGHFHTGVPKPGAETVEPGGKYTKTGTFPYGEDS